MTIMDWFQIGAFFIALLAGIPLLGPYMARVLQGERSFASPALAPVEGLIYRLAGVNPQEEQGWRSYAGALLAFNVQGFALVFLLQLAQGWLPLNPRGLPGVEPWLAFNTASSFMTNTNWQSYAGEITLSYATQMLGLTVQNFVSAATGISVLAALARGLSRKTASSIGNFWADLVRSTLYILLPLSIVVALLLISQGVVQNFAPYRETLTLSGETQVLPMGPAASQIAIKQLGTNGGGFFNVNSAHPFENPTPFSNVVQMLSILLIPAALTETYGRLVGNPRQGRVLLIAMLVLFVAGLAIMFYAENQPNTVNGLTTLMEGKEQRFGVTSSVLWGAATTAASNGSVNALHSSFSPIAGAVAMINILLGEIIFGGVGAGLYGMLVFVVLTVFIAGLMVGRTPEYLGKKIEGREVQMAILAVLLPALAVLLGTAMVSSLPAGLASRASLGPHGFSEMLYAFASAGNNNGSAFAGLNANVPLYNGLLGLAMWIGRFGVILPVLSIAGSMVGKTITPPSPGTFPTDGPLFVVLLIGVILIVGGLTFFPALTLGPLAEHLLMLAGRAF